MYTFILITDPLTAASDGRRADAAGSATIPGTSGRTLRQVIEALWRGPWVEFATRNPQVQCTEREVYTPPLPEAHADEAPPAPPANAAELGERIQRTRGIDNDALRTGIEQGTSLLLTSARPVAPASPLRS